MSLYIYRVSAAKVVDGDTLDVTLDLGFRIHHQVRVRLKGIDAPEMRTAAGKSAKAFAEAWVARGSIVVHTFKDATEKYGRYLAIVMMGDEDLAESLVKAGHAVYKTY